MMNSDGIIHWDINNVYEHVMKMNKIRLRIIADNRSCVML
jgi:hypothetical protein